MTTDAPASTAHDIHDWAGPQKALFTQRQSRIYAILRWLFTLLLRIRIQGTVPATFPGIVIANHTSFLDGVLLALFLPFNPVFLVHTTVVNTWYFRLILRFVDHLPVDPSNPMAIKQAVRLVESGRPIAIFPEGRITITGSLMKVYDGPAWVAARTGAAILPVHLDGTIHSYFSRMRPPFPRQPLPKVTISFQPLVTLPAPQGPTAKLRRRKAGVALRRLMQHTAFASRPRQTLYAALLLAMRTYGRRRLLVEDIRRTPYSYQGLLRMSLALGRLAERHSEPGETVGILLPNAAPAMGLLFGLWARGRKAAMLNYTAGTEGMQAACTAAKVRTIFASRTFLEQAGLVDKVAALKGVKVLMLEDLRAQLRLLDKLWILARLLLPDGFEQAPDPEAVAVVLFTSGTEGRPKGVALSHRAVLANVTQALAVIDVGVTDKLLSAMPIFHAFGLTVGAILPVIAGASVFLYPSPLHYRVIPELAYDRNCTLIFGTSTFLGHYASYANPYDFRHMRYVVAGAERLSETVGTQWFELFGLRILEGYGATETAPVLAVNTPMAFRSGSVGELLPGVEARLEPVEGIDEGGLLHVRGPNLMSGYLRVDAPGRLDPPSSSMGPGWYATGDIVTIDDDGYVRVQGRVKRFAKIAGEMLSLESVERLAAKASPKGRHAVVARPDTRRGEAVVLFTTDGTVTREALLASARDGGWPELALPREIRHVDALPLLGTGKVDYVTLAALAASGQ